MQEMTDFVIATIKLRVCNISNDRIPYSGR